jgi:hypothetical protein
MRLELVSEQDRGIADACNRAVRRARGDYFTPVEADNFYLPKHIETGIKYLLANPHVAGVGMSQQMMNADGVRLFDWTAPRLDFFGLVCQERVLPSGSTIRNRRILGEDVYYLVDERIRHCCDYEYWVRLAAKNFRVDALPDVTYATRLSDKSGSCDLSRYPEFCREKILALDHVLESSGKSAIHGQVRELGRAGIFMWAAELTWGLGGPYRESLNFTQEAMNNYPAYPRISAFLDRLAQETGRDPRADLVASVDVIPMLVRSMAQTQANS